MIVIGLDLSLAKTGFTVLKDGVVLDSGIIKSKPSGDKPLDEIQRISKIKDDILDVIHKAGSGEVELVVIEGLAFMARNTTALVQLSGLNYMVRDVLNYYEIPFLIVAPTTLKKFVTGSGKGDKDRMSMIVYKEYGFESLDNNVADSYGLAVCGMAVLDKPVKTPTAPQKEVIKLLKTQL